ncbi:unnamed protein product [Pylaiella littoralis]
MSSSLLPSAEWISTAARRAAATTPNASSGSSSSAGRCRQHPPTSSTDDTNSPHQHSGAGGAGPAGSNDREQRDEEVVGHRGSGGLVRGRAVFCLPPEVEWFQGHFAYTAVGGCSASLGILGTELDVDACMQCCHGGFSRHKLVFIHHESGKESTLIVERYGGNMMSLHAEPSLVAGGDGPVPPESELSFQTHVMKADDDARKLLDRYFQSIVRAASDPAELQDCIVCIGQMEVPQSLLQELAAPQPVSRTQQSMVCSAFAPCRETQHQHHEQDQQQQPEQQQQQHHHHHHHHHYHRQEPHPQQPLPTQRQEREASSTRNTPLLSPYQSERGEEEGTEPTPSPPPAPAVAPAEGQGQGEGAAVAPSSSSCCSSIDAAAAAVDAAADAVLARCSAKFRPRNDDGDGGRLFGDEVKEEEGMVKEAVGEASRSAEEVQSSSSIGGGGGGGGATSRRCGKGYCAPKTETKAGVVGVPEAAGTKGVGSDGEEENDWLE